MQVDILDLDPQPFEPSAMGLVRQSEIELLLIGLWRSGGGVDDIGPAAPSDIELEPFETEIREVVGQTGEPSPLARLVERRRRSSR